MASLDFEQEKQAFRDYYSDNFDRLSSAAESLRTLIYLLLADRNTFETPVVASRLKEREECVGKFKRKYQSKLEKSATPYEIKDYITDLIGLRIVCLYNDEIPKIREIMEANFMLVQVTDKIADMESSDDSFGYKALHLDLRLKEPRASLPEYDQIRNLQFELQIRTIVQDAWGNLDHKIKYKKAVPPPLARRINVLSALFELADQEFRKRGTNYMIPSRPTSVHLERFPTEEESPRWTSQPGKSTCGRTAKAV